MTVPESPAAPAVPDPLRGHTLDEAQEKALRAAGAADAITMHLATYAYSERNPVRLNLEAERDAFEQEATFWEGAVREALHTRRTARLRARQATTGLHPTIAAVLRPWWPGRAL